MTKAQGKLNTSMISCHFLYRIIFFFLLFRTRSQFGRLSRKEGGSIVCMIFYPFFGAHTREERKNSNDCSNIHHCGGDTTHVGTFWGALEQSNLMDTFWRVHTCKKDILNRYSQKRFDFSTKWNNRNWGTRRIISLFKVPLCAYANIFSKLTSTLLTIFW